MKGILVLFVLVVVLCAGAWMCRGVIAPAATVLTGESAKDSMSDYADESLSEYTEGWMDQEPILSYEQAKDLTGSIMQHDERMTDKVVSVAVSADRAQYAGSVAQSITAAASGLFPFLFLVLIVGGVVLVMIFGGH